MKLEFRITIMFNILNYYYYYCLHNHYHRRQVLNHISRAVLMVAVALPFPLSTFISSACCNIFVH